MSVKDGELFRAIERLGEHYRSNINNRYLRKALLTMLIDNRTWERVESFTELAEYVRAQGLQFHEIYEAILALARFIRTARNELLPHLRSILSRSGGTTIDSGGSVVKDGVLRDMAVSNFPSNLGIMSDMVNDIYMRTVELDKLAHKTKAPVFTRIPELKDLGQMLI
jgi:hypothetical protein